MILYIVLIFFNCFSGPNQSKPSLDQPPQELKIVVQTDSKEPVNVNITNANTTNNTTNTSHNNLNNASNSNTANATASNNTSVLQQTSAHLHAWLHNHVANRLTSIPSWQEGKQRTAQWMLANKKRLAIGTAAGLYLIIQAELFYIYVAMRNEKRWCNWRNNLSLAGLQSYPAKKLGDMLIKDVQQQYLNPKNPIDYIYPLTYFIRDIEYEEKMLQRYKAICNTLYCGYVAKPFFISAKTIANAEKKLQRIHFVKHVFISWTAELNLEKIYTKKQRQEIKKLTKKIYPKRAKLLDF